MWPDKPDPERLKDLHRRLLEEIRDEAALTRRFTGRAEFSTAVMEAMAAVPRHEFVREDDIAYAYVNRPREIGHGQTISQPYIVALMTDLLEAEPGHRVLEIGTGSGYQAAVLSRLVAEVWSVEAIEPLAEAAARRLTRLGHGNVRVRQGDGYLGWPERAPFDRIIVTASPPEVPAALLDQLKPGGRMVVPVGLPYDSQVLQVCAKDLDGKVKCQDVLGVAFVPMVHPRTLN